jgi:hypothetical protein
MWFDRVEGSRFHYIPSWAHHNKGHLPSFRTYEEAFRKARLMMASVENTSSGAIALFRPTVICQKNEPKFKDDNGKYGHPCELVVTRVAVNHDGIISPKEGYIQE